MKGVRNMIYTVTFNPSLDYIVSVDDFKLGLTNRTSSELMLPGGKGINVSIVLKNLGIQSTALGFMAGFMGKEIARRLEEEGVASDFIQIEEGISRINLKLKSIDGTEINGIPVYHMDDFPAKQKEYGATIGVITVPVDKAQEVTELIIAGGIKALWNFTPFRIRVPEDIVVQNTSMYAHLAVMFNRLNSINH